MGKTSGATHAAQQAILMAIYAVFLGGVITAFVAVGLFTFYPQPSTYEAQIIATEQQQAEIYADCKTASCQPTAEQQARDRQLQTEREQLQAAADREMKAWSRVAGVIVIGIATVLLAVSLIKWDRAIVISNGLLLGGLFTMVFGIILTLIGGEGMMRFLVLTAALAITVILGYLRFARVQARPKVSAPATVPGEVSQAPGAAASDLGEVHELAQRVAALESRMDRIGRALQD